MHALVVVAVPARAERAAAEPRAVLRAVVVEDVVFAGHIEDLFRAAVLQQLLEYVELRRLGEVGQVAGVEDELGGAGQGVDAGDGLAEGGGDVEVGGFVEADVAVADLHEVQLTGGQDGRGTAGGLSEHARAEHAAGYGPEHASAGPGHAFEEAAAVDAVMVVVMGNVVIHGIHGVLRPRPVKNSLVEEKAARWE